MHLRVPDTLWKVWFFLSFSVLVIVRPGSSPGVHCFPHVFSPRGARFSPLRDGKMINVRGPRERLTETSLITPTKRLNREAQRTAVNTRWCRLDRDAKPELTPPRPTLALSSRLAPFFTPVATFPSHTKLCFCMASPSATLPVRVDVSRVVELPTVLRLMYASFAAGGCLGLWGGVLGCTDFLCQDQPEKRRRARQIGALVTMLCGISAAGILVLTAPSSKYKA